MPIAASALTNSQRRVVGLLFQNGPMTKRELCRKGGIAWGTAVNAVEVLRSAGLVVPNGTSYRSLQAGKNAYLYALSPGPLVVIGVDMNYDTTTINACSIGLDVIASEVLPSPNASERRQVTSYLIDALEGFIRKHSYSGRVLGIGIGIPGLLYQLLHTDTGSNRLAALEDELQTHLETPVSIDVNNRAYARLRNRRQPQGNGSYSLYVFVRSGLGSALLLGDQVIDGANGLAGEIGHIHVPGNKRPCRCGLTGCLETVLNQSYLREHYLQIRESVTGRPEQSARRNDLEDIFDLAHAGSQEAREVLRLAAHHLAVGLSAAVIMMNVHRIVISGLFGQHGEELFPFLQEELDRTVPSFLPFELVYHQLEQGDFPRGAAFLVTAMYMRT